MNAITMSAIGDNNPPEETRPSIQEARDAFAGLTDFLKMYPVIQSHDEAKKAATYITSAKDVLNELEEDRDGLVRPLNEKVRETNSQFKAVREPLEKLLTELQNRVGAFMAAEEEKREAELREARRLAAEAEARAREAEAREHEAIQNAAEGEFTDVGGATAEADAAFKDFERADRVAAVTARDAKVKIKGLGGGRALSMRTTETLKVTDPIRALVAIIAVSGGLPEKIEAAIISSARDVRKLKGELPVGVESEKSRSL